MNTLIVDLHLVRREGWKLPRFRTCMYKPVRGVLRLKEERADDLNRLCRVATLIGLDKQPLSAVRPLYDAMLIAAEHDRLTLTGFERVWWAGRWLDFAQTWLLDVVEVRDPARLDAPHEDGTGQPPGDGSTPIGRKEEK